MELLTAGGVEKEEGADKPKIGLEKFSFTPSAGGSGFSFGGAKSEVKTGFNFEKGFSFGGTMKDSGKDESQKGSIAGKSEEKKENTGFQFKLEPKPESVSKPAEKETSPFKFTFTPSGKASGSDVRSPEIDREGMYVNKEGEDDHIHFEPLIQLPDKVDLVTGEENENVLFQHRAKLFRFQNNEWKERGLGDIKILENKRNRKVRIVMRREQILKICCNHYLSPDMELKPMPKSDGKAWLWYAMDFADDEPSTEQFSIKFKNAEVANDFKIAFDSAKGQGGDTTDSEPAGGDVSSAGDSEESVPRSQGVRELVSQWEDKSSTNDVVSVPSYHCFFIHVILA